MSKKTFVAFLVLTLFLAVAKPVNAGWYVNRLGWLVYETPNVLGDEDEVKIEERTQTSEQKRETEKKEAESKKENRNEKREVEYFDASQNAWIKAKTEAGKAKMEIKTLDGQEIKTETEREQYKLKFKSEAGILKLEAETEDGEETELGEDDDNEVEIEDRDDDKIRVATGSSDREMTFSRNRVRARTNFPLSVDLSTNELIVTTPNGVKRVTVLPDQAIANLLANNVVDRLEPESKDELELTETEDGTPAYEVSGESDQKFLGFMPVRIKSRLKVSAETGEVLTNEKPALARLLDWLSF